MITFDYEKGRGGPGEAREKFGTFYSKKHKDLLSEIAFIFRVDS